MRGIGEKLSGGSRARGGGSQCRRAELPERIMTKIGDVCASSEAEVHKSGAKERQASSNEVQGQPASTIQRKEGGGWNTCDDPLHDLIIFYASEGGEGDVETVCRQRAGNAGGSPAVVGVPRDVAP